MKHTTHLLLLSAILILFSCKKTYDSGIKQKDITLTTSGTGGAAVLLSTSLNIPAYQSVQSGMVLNPHIVSIVNNGAVQTVNYENGVVAVIRPDAHDVTKYDISLTYGTKTANVTGKLTTSGGLTTVQLLSGNTVYWSYQLNASNQINNLTLNEVIYPYQTLAPNGRLTYQQCMHQVFLTCTRSWYCSTICGIAIMACTMGNSLNCVAVSLG